MEEYIVYRWVKNCANIVGVEEEAESLDRAKDRTNRLISNGKKVFYMKKKDFIKLHTDIYKNYLNYVAEKAGVFIDS